MKYRIAHFRKNRKELPTEDAFLDANRSSDDDPCFYINIKDLDELNYLAKKYGKLMICPPGTGPFKEEWFIWVSDSGFSQR